MLLSLSVLYWEVLRIALSFNTNDHHDCLLCLLRVHLCLISVEDIIFYIDTYPSSWLGDYYHSHTLYFFLSAFSLLSSVLIPSIYFFSPLLFSLLISSKKSTQHPPPLPTHSTPPHQLVFWKCIRWSARHLPIACTCHVRTWQQRKARRVCCKLSTHGSPRRSSHAVPSHPLRGREIHGDVLIRR